MSPRAALQIEPVDRPLVSVLMVTYGALDWVRRAIGALVEHTPPAYELVVVDNGSTDGTREFLRGEVAGATVLDAPGNVGFGAANDLAALHARGRFVCLLNSDAVVPPGWLDPLVARFDDPRVGAVVPRYVFPDGTLQEAGCVVEPDGRVVALGARADADDPQLEFAREVPYGSAACMLVPRRLFRELGGFDAAYGTAYYEDVDFAFRLRARRLRVVLEPSVRIVHAQGASSSSITAAEARRDANQQRFRRRWSTVLWHRPVVFGAPQPHRFAAARDADAVDRVLVLAPSEPVTARAAARGAAALARTLDAGRVTIAWFGSMAPVGVVAELCAAGVEVADRIDAPAWLEQRRFHYSVVAGEGDDLRSLATVLAETQPQATATSLPHARIDDRAELARWLLGLGLVPVGIRP